MAMFERPVARAQANLYARFFGRPRIAVDLFLRDEQRLESHEESADLGLAEEVLETFARVDGGAEAVPPREFKCSRCEFRERCPVLNDRS